MGGFLHDITAMGIGDWLHLAGLVGLLAIIYGLGMEAGYEKAKGNGGIGWPGFWIIAFYIAACEIASNAGTPIPPWWSSIPGYGD